MFIIEKFRSDYHERVDGWERARDKWVENDPSDYGYRTDRDYERSHPHPYAKVKSLIKVVLVTVPVLVVAAGIVFLIVKAEQRRQAQLKRPEVVQTAGNNCQDFKVNDFVRVQYGTYADVTGIIIGGCTSPEDYQIKLSDNQRADVPGDGHGEAVDVGGRTIGVDSSSNLVVIKEDKK